MEKNMQDIILQNINEVRNSIVSGNIQVCIIGIGRIGLPTALSIAKSGLPTIGVDINVELVNKINSGEFPLKDEPGYAEIFDEVRKKKLFSATTKIEEVVPKSDVILLSLPTPMDENNIPDYSAIKLVGKQLNKLLTKKSLIVVESTIEPGFIENDLLPIVEVGDRVLKAGQDFSIGVCPETANPGEILKDFTNLPRLVGGINEKTTISIMEIYKHVFPVELIKMPDCKTANAVKLTTNVFRDVNIAFVNEISLLFERIGVDTFTVLEAARKKYNFQIHYPGAGVGGPCLPVNSYQMINSANTIDSNFLTIVRAGRIANEKMPLHVIELLSDALKELGKTIEQSTILILGISYKPDVKDIQLTPAKKIITELKKKGADVKIYDPYFKSSTVFEIHIENNLHEIIKEADGVIIVTAHKEFQNIDPTFFSSKMKNPVVVDSRGVIDPHSARKAGLIFRGIGRKI